MTRRTLLRTGVGAALAARSGGAQSLESAPHVRLGIDTYTLRSYKWKAHQLLDYAARLNLDTIQLDLNDYESLEPPYVGKVREHAARAGIKIDGSMGCVCPSSSAFRRESGGAVEYLRTGLRVSRVAGAACLRVFVGGGAERAELAKHIENTLKVLRAVRSEAVDAGVKIAIENHGDFQAWELRDLIETAGKEYVGACLDSGNAVAALENPLTTLEVLGPYVATTHIRDSGVFEHPRGAVMQWVALGDGCVDFKTFFEQFRQVCPGSGVQLEILTGSPPRVIPYLEPDFWKAFPNAKASEFARFVKLVRDGHPFMGSMIIASSGKGPKEYDAALREQQRVDLERSLAYAKTVLGLGRA